MTAATVAVEFDDGRGAIESRFARVPVKGDMLVPTDGEEGFYWVTGVMLFPSKGIVARVWVSREKKRSDK